MKIFLKICEILLAIPGILGLFVAAIAILDPKRTPPEATVESGGAKLFLIIGLIFTALSYGCRSLRQKIKEQDR